MVLDRHIKQQPFTGFSGFGGRIATSVRTGTKEIGTVTVTRVNNGASYSNEFFEFNASYDGDVDEEDVTYAWTVPSGATIQNGTTKSVRVKFNSGGSKSVTCTISSPEAFDSPQSGSRSTNVSTLPNITGVTITREDPQKNVTITQVQPTSAGPKFGFEANLSGSGTNVNQFTYTWTSSGGPLNRSSGSSYPSNHQMIGFRCSGTQTLCVRVQGPGTNKVGTLQVNVGSPGPSPLPNSSTPKNGATKVSPNTNLTVNWNQSISRATGVTPSCPAHCREVRIYKGNQSKAVFDRTDGSTSGSTMSFGQIGGLDLGTTYKVCVGGRVVKNSSGTVNEAYYGTWNFTTVDQGEAVEGGYLVLAQSGKMTIVAPANTQVSVPQQNISNAVSCAQSRTGCSGWYIPTGTCMRKYMQCRQYWDTYTSAPSGQDYDFGYWTSSTCKAALVSGEDVYTFPRSCVFPTRAFRDVTY